MQHKNLLKLSSAAYLEGFYYKPRIDHETMKEFSEGVLCIAPSFNNELVNALDERINGTKYIYN